MIGPDKNTREKRQGEAGGWCGVRVVCIGETMVMFAPRPHELIEYCDQFTALVGGAEANVAIGLERLGVHAGWIGKMPANALARKLVNETRSFGVDTSAVVWTEKGRVGTFFVEWGAPPRPLKTIYDRANSTATTMTADDLDWDYIKRAEWVDLTGITPALSATCCAATVEIAQRAREAGLKVVFDVNYRSLLWSREEARAACERILPFVNLLVATEPDMELFLGARLGREQALREACRRYPLDAAAMTLGGEGSMGCDGQALYQASGHTPQGVNRLGAGDAFVAGLLYGYLKSGLAEGLRYGNAMATLKFTIPQNIPIVNKEDVERLVQGGNATVIR
jgi:2-dehydro-3-deoxygluconokinase